MKSIPFPMTQRLRKEENKNKSSYQEESDNKEQAGRDDLLTEATKTRQPYLFGNKNRASDSLPDSFVPKGMFGLPCFPLIYLFREVQASEFWMSMSDYIREMSFLPGGGLLKIGGSGTFS